MKELKCECCGGIIDLDATGTKGKCRFCGAVYSYKTPKDDLKIEAMNEANYLRTALDFDGAINKFQYIIDRMEGGATDAEAWWGLLLSKYGVVYEEDELEGKRIPTFHRNQKSSIVDAEEYKDAIAYATAEQAAQYKSECIYLRNLQIGIEKKAEELGEYDVFISFKATDLHDGERKTKDRDIAYEIYNKLTDNDIKAFFSEVTLAESTGAEYEPIIFNALNTCKVFILVGTSKENINATWVKNEWTRYIERLKEDRKLGLKPSMYFAVFGDDLKPEDLPRLFVKTQNIDLSKYVGNGYVNDIYKNIANALGITERKKKEQEEAQKKYMEEQLAEIRRMAASGGGAAPSIDALLERADHMLNVGDFQGAHAKYDQVLDYEPSNADALWGVWLINNGVNGKEKYTFDSKANSLAEYRQMSEENDKKGKKFISVEFDNLKAAVKEDSKCKPALDAYGQNRERYQSARTQLIASLYALAKSHINSKKYAVAAQELEQVQKDSRLFASGLDSAEIEQTLSKTKQAAVDQANREQKSREKILKSAKFIPALIFLAIFGLSGAITAVGCMISQSVSYTAGGIALVGGIIAIALVYSKYLVKRGYKCKNTMIVFILVQLFGTAIVTMLASVPVAIAAVVGVLLAVVGVGSTVLAVMKNKKYLDLVATIRAERRM